MKYQLLKENLDKILLLTILVPTHNRKTQLKNCLISIRQLFNNYCDVIVCDNSSIMYDDIKQLLTTEKYINLRDKEGNIQCVYLTLLNNVKTKYCLIVEDDDYLINLNTHIKCLLYLDNNYKVVSFGSSDNLNFYMNKMFNDKLINVPFFWNGDFLFGMAYFETETLKKAFNKWINFLNEDKSFIIHSDEIITLIAILDSLSYIHNPNIGMKIGINNDNLSWGNPELTLYSTVISCNYLFKLYINLIDKKWKNDYITILLNELNTLFINKTLNKIIFNSSYIFLLKNNINQKIKNYAAKKEYLLLSINFYIKNIL